MNTDELESRFEGLAEAPSLELKGACSWDASRFAKDILALSNVQDGGIIIIGIEDKTFARQGISAAQQATFNLDIMRDQIAGYADPHVSFTVEFPLDRGGRMYAVIKVSQFAEIPTICSRDSSDTRAGVIYYRNSNRRVESAAVSNSYDMRQIIDLATVKMMQRLQRLGFLVEPSGTHKFDEELKGL